MNPNEATLVVAGVAYAGWTRLEVQRSIEQIAGGFVVQLTRQGGAAPLAGLGEGLACQVRLGSDVVVSGYIDEVETDDTATGSSLRISGRDATGDLVDCSAIFKTGQWRGVKLEGIVADIAKPFGIAVITETDTGEAFKRFALEEGEKAFDAIDRACRLRGVLVTSTSMGQLLITTAGTGGAGVELAEGVNMLKYHSKHSWRERYSVVTLKGQVPGDDDESGAAVAHLKAVALDKQITRYRPLVVVAEHGTSNKALGQRAAWEIAVRMGRGKRGGCTVLGWRTGGNGTAGALWSPNTMVRVRSPRMGLDMDMLIVACSYQLTEQGQLTEITFARREAFELTNGVGRSRLNARLNDKMQAEKKQKGDGFVPSWALTPANPRDTRGAP